MIDELYAIAAERLGRDAAGVLARVAGVTAVEAPTARRRAELVVMARAPIPPSLRAVHPTWIEHALAELPARARAAVAAASAEPVDVWLARWATHAMPAVPIDARLPALAAENDAAVVVDWLGRIGADQLAFALGEQARAVPALAAAVARIGKPPRAGQLGPQRAAIERCRNASLDDDLSFVLVGCRALAPHLAAQPVARLQLIVRLPRPVGIVVARELADHAAISLDQCPRWAALDAHVV